MAEVDSVTDGAPTAAPGTTSQVDNTQESNAANASLIDSNLSKRPRDAHTIHLILHRYGVLAYQERVPLQLMDFAYRYTRGILQDALHFTNESYPGLGTGAGGGSKANAEGSTVNVQALRLAIRSRTHYQYSPNLPKDFYKDLAEEKNRIALPPVQKGSGLALPPEQYMLTGQSWEMAEDFDLLETEGLGDINMQDQDLGDPAEENDEVEGGTMEDIFGPNGAAGGDEDMQES